MHTRIKTWLGNMGSRARCWSLTVYFRELAAAWAGLGRTFCFAPLMGRLSHRPTTCCSSGIVDESSRGCLAASPVLTASGQISQRELAAVADCPISRLIYYIGCLVIALISVHDAMLIVANHGIISQVELNPLGLWLLELGGGEVWLFVCTKILTTSVAVTAMLLLYQSHRCLAWRVMPGVAIFQAGLLYCLACI